MSKHGYLQGDPNSVSCKPNLLVLFNPALFYQGAQDTLKLEHFTPETPPTIMFYGTNDPMLKDFARPLQVQAAKMGFSLQTYEAAALDREHREGWKLHTE